MCSIIEKFFNFSNTLEMKWMERHIEQVEHEVEM